MKPQLSDWLVNTPMYEFKKLINDKLDNNETLDRVNLEKFAPNIVEGVIKLKEWSNSI